MRGLLLGLSCLATTVVHGHEFFSTKITWTREISRIVYKSCAGCHREGGQAFSLLTFEEVRPWAVAIKEEVLGRRMPPWGAAKGFGSFAHDRGLSQDEISLIADWVEGGAPEGQRIYLPKLPAALASGGPQATKLREQPLPLVPLARPVTISGIAPRGPVPVGAQLTAELPDGSTEPLLWILDPAAATKREFVFQDPKVFPAGTRFRLSKSGGSWKILSSVR
jgi:hypothetical protein